ncbi:MAG: hypothetical protein CVT80_07395 [Alphaproteobacteria bacterium HGW-Alphaproteobacteria-2]|nr:MAG: hypothetical protein CVT80_07395 [Alphaproteobacteria bacterium HGW-Alphaproteobacteria-2]
MFWLADGEAWGVHLLRGEANMRERVAAQMAAYWESLRAGRPAPQRSEIDPRQIEGLLPYTLVLEWRPDGPVRIRLAGAHVTGLMGMELRGMPLESILEPEARATLAAEVAELFARPALLDADLLSEGRGRLPMRARMALFPLTSDRGEMTRALGCIAAEGVVGLPPRRFTIERLRLRPVGTLAAPMPHAAPAGLAEEASAFVPAPAARHLRLVKG